MANFSVAFLNSLPQETVDGRLLLVKNEDANECSMYFEHKLSPTDASATRMTVIPCPQSTVAKTVGSVQQILSQHFKG